MSGFLSSRVAEVQLPLNVASKAHVCLAVVVSLVTLGLCAAIPSPERSEWVCNQDPPIAVYDDTYNIHSNRYGSGARECISVRGTSFTVADSSLSNSRRNRPGGYPSIYKGCHWG